MTDDPTYCRCGKRKNPTQKHCRHCDGINLRLKNADVREENKELVNNRCKDCNTLIAEKSIRCVSCHKVFQTKGNT